MEEPSDRIDHYLRLILFLATLMACAAQITSSMSLIDELACHPPAETDHGGALEPGCLQAMRGQKNGPQPEAAGH